MNPCSFGTFVKGRQNSAEWIRTAFHDMVTHDAKAGTGGLDASIFFELDRPENIGSAFNNTFGFFSGYHNVRATASDLIALGVVTATGACGGPQVQLRGGRRDASEAGPAGVPEPQTDLDTTLATFENAGFSQRDMIAMVACGHALGGVHSVDFPDLVEIPADPENDTSVPFQSDNSQFHNGIITEFLANSTSNPLVVASNDTLNSDKRIFESDGRKTMKELMDGDSFKNMCGDIFTRMIDTVPTDVVLTDVIEPYDVKPTIEELSLNDDGDLVFRGDIRLRTTKGIRDPDDIALKLTYSDRNGDCKKSVIHAQRATFQGGITSGIHGESFITFTFDSIINGQTGIRSFMIHETVVSTNKTVIHDNQGTGGYPVQDTVLHQLSESCQGPYQDGKFPVTVTAMVREERATGLMRLDIVHRQPRQGVIVPELKVESVDFVPAGNKGNKWVQYRAETTILDSTTFDIVLGEDKAIVIPFLKTSAFPNTCST